MRPAARGGSRLLAAAPTLGVQVESKQELAVLREQVARAEIAALDQRDAKCCYARSDK
jgi:hypothetical protein